MTPLLLTDIERAVRSSWSAETCTPEFRSHWSEDNPARDQRGVTAMVLHDLLGGELLRGEVHVGGERVDYHWWNRLGMGIEIDLTREQFGPEEIVTEGIVIPRPPVSEWRRLRQDVRASPRPHRGKAQPIAGDGFHDRTSLVSLSLFDVCAASAKTVSGSRRPSPP